MEQTLGHKYDGSVHEIHLKGWERVWTCVRPFNAPQAVAAGAPKIDAHFLRDGERLPIIGAAELNIHPKKRGRINGVLYLITDEELLSLDKRERGYQRADATDRIEEFRDSVTGAREQSTLNQVGEETVSLVPLTTEPVFI